MFKVEVGLFQNEHVIFFIEADSPDDALFKARRIISRLTFSDITNIWVSTT